jgi:hypothetical protein
MADNFYQDMQGIASDLLKEFDQTNPGIPASPQAVGGNGIYYVGMVPGTGPADNPGPPQEAAPIKLDAVARGVSFKYVDGANVVTTDLQATMAVRSDMTPQMPGFMIVDGKRHKIVEVKQKPAAGIPVAYTVIFRK